MKRLLSGLCGLLVVATSVRADDWPQWLGPKRDGVWREAGIVPTFPKDGPPVRWRTEIGGGYAGPTVAGGRVYVADRLTDGSPNAGRRAGKERVLCLDDATGKILWKHEYDCPYDARLGYPAGPRVSPIVHGDKVYSLGAMGDLFCLEEATGKVLWSKNFRTDYDAPLQNWGFSANPLLDGDKLICVVGGKGSVAVAFHKDTGQELWKALSSAPGQGYCPPMIFEAGGRRQLIIWHPEAVNGLDPETGKVFWSVPFDVKANLTIPTPRLEGNLLFVTCFYNGPMMLKLAADKPEASVLWRGKSNSEQPRLTDGLHSIICTPFLKDGYIYGVCSYGQLRCLKADTGERLWETLKATGTEDKPVERWANAFIVAQGDRFFLFNEKGDLIIARLTPKGYDEISRAHIIEPNNRMPGRPVVWSHPAFAHQCVYARNDKEIVCVSLAARTWEGTWQGEDKGHMGELRSIVRQLEGQKWEAKFTGTCNRQFAYEVQMQGRRDGDKVLFEGQADLGEKDGGVYRWTGQLVGDQFDGQYQSVSGKKGKFEMKPAEKQE